jgi:hypothetical protein
VLKRPGSMYRPGRQTAWRKYKASHRATARLRGIRSGRDGHTNAVCELGGRRVTTLGSPRLAALVGRRVDLTYSRIDADGSLREVRISAIDAHRGIHPHAPGSHPAPRTPRSVSSTGGAARPGEVCDSCAHAALRFEVNSRG